jgi:general secretion pathway protein H
LDRRKIARPAQRGLTLIELLVVVVILALASTVVLLNAPPSRPAVRDDAERFAARMQIALDEAIASGAAMRVSIDASGYLFEALKGSEWVAMDKAAALARKDFDQRTTATPEIEDAANDNARALGAEENVETGEDEDKSAAHIMLDPLGAQAAFKVRFSSADGAWTVTVSDGAKVTVKQDA